MLGKVLGVSFKWLRVIGFKSMVLSFKLLAIVGAAVLVSSCAFGIKGVLLPLRTPVSTCMLEHKFGEYLGTYEGVDYNGFHTGLDLIVEPGTPVSAMAAGKVIRVGVLFAKPSDGGWYTVIDHESLGIHTQYLHTKKPRVKIGALVQRGEVIAEVIQPTLFPAHLHVEVKPRDVVIRKPDGSIGYFANKLSTPKGNHGYVLSEADLNQYWRDPMLLMQTWCKDLP
jgi:murein DD-endopeptidase MepM/ murein hydrolase activator NlpD